MKFLYDVTEHERIILIAMLVSKDGVKVPLYVFRKDIVCCFLILKLRYCDEGIVLASCLHCSLMDELELPRKIIFLFQNLLHKANDTARWVMEERLANLIVGYKRLMLLVLCINLLTFSLWLFAIWSVLFHIFIHFVCLTLQIYDITLN